MTVEQPAIRLVGDRPTQCKDIPDAVFLDAIRRTPATGSLGWRLRHEVHRELEASIGALPEKLFLAKARQLEKRGLLGGCTCGCRGDWHPADECTGGPTCCKTPQAGAS